VGLAAGLLVAFSGAASARTPTSEAGTPGAVRDAALSKPRAGSPEKTPRHGPGTAHAHQVHGTDTSGGDTGSADRDLALAATWEVDPTLLAAQPGDSATTLDARARLAAVAGHLRIVMDRYDNSQKGAERAAELAATTRAELRHARVEAAAAHRVYVRDHRLLAELVTTSYEEGPLTSLEFILAADDADELAVRMGTMEQLGDNQASVVTDADYAAGRMRATAEAARLAAEAARAADQKAADALARATDAGHRVLDQLDEAREVLSLSVLADQMQTRLADAIRFANTLAPGSVSFPLPPGSGFYDNHNWGQRSARWKSFHTGDDYSVACGTPVLAATGGRIEILTGQGWAGHWLVMVSTGRGKLTTWYAHMEKLAVKAGQHVKPGQVIGLVGDDGNATGCHLHFELHPDGGSIYQDTTDPDPWLRAVGAYPGS
jgi:murein DD-endopeptidase MepM/ murein hydrolase activator NlpD